MAPMQPQQTQQDTPDITQLVPMKPALRVQEIYQNGVEYLRTHPEQVIPQGKAPWANNESFFGEPFIVVSAWMYRTQKSDFDAEGWKQVQVYICPVDMDTWEVGEPVLASFHGKALLNQFRSLVPNDLIGMGIFTIGKHQYKTGQQAAWVFRYYQHGADNTVTTVGKDAILLPSTPSPFDVDADVKQTEALKRGAGARNGQTQKERDEAWIQVESLMAQHEISYAEVAHSAGWVNTNGKPPDSILWVVQQIIRERALKDVRSSEDITKVVGKKTR